jgi:hypothetical protein
VNKMSTEVNDNTEITIPIRNLLGMIASVAIAVWGYFGIVERLNSLENEADKQLVYTKMNSEFRVKWPRGELGALPADSKQDMMIDFLQERITKLEVVIEALENGSN